jgi:hypothetical protein
MGLGYCNTRAYLTGSRNSKSSFSYDLTASRIITANPQAWPGCGEDGESHYISKIAPWPFYERDQDLPECDIASIANARSMLTVASSLDVQGKGYALYSSQFAR